MASFSDRYGGYCTCTRDKCSDECTTYRRFKPKPITQGDRIRNMTDEELDKFLGEVQWDVAKYCGGVTQNQEYPFPEHKGAWLDWLKQEASQ